MKEILNRLNGAAVYTKSDLKNIYHKTRIREGNERKTISKTRYGHSEHKIILFNFINVPVIFQAYINKALTDFIDINCIAYLNNIFIYFPFILNISDIFDRCWNVCANMSYILNYLNTNSLLYQ
jgi:hypothetical protein